MSRDLKCLGGLKMKVLIVSDSHRKNENLKKVLAKMRGSHDRMVHLGDCECDPKLIEEMAGCPLDIVRGNCDWGRDELPLSKIVDFEGHRALLMHGHQAGSFLSHDALRGMARANDVEIVMYGHTHVPVIDHQEGIWIVNPGSVSLPRQDGRQKTYLVMNIEHGRVDFVPVML